jgi:hypothetical protein
MQKTTTIVLFAALTLVAAALIGVTLAQTSTPNPTANPSQTVAPWRINPDATAQNCYDATGTAPYCYNTDGTYPAGYCYGAGTVGYCANPQGYSEYGAQACNQFNYGSQAGYGYQGGRMGNCGRGW